MRSQATFSKHNLERPTFVTASKPPQAKGPLPPSREGAGICAFLWGSTTWVPLQGWPQSRRPKLAVWLHLQSARHLPGGSR